MPEGKQKLLLIFDYQHGAVGTFVYADSKAALEAVVPRPPAYVVIDGDVDNHPFLKGRVRPLMSCDIDAPNVILQEAMDYKPVEDEQYRRAQERRERGLPPIEE